MPSTSLLPTPPPAALEPAPVASTMADVTPILLVDPDPFLQEIIESGFKLFNPEWKILKADNPASALLILGKQKVELVITEVDFPDAHKTGIDFLADIADFSPQMPIIVLSEVAPEEIRGLTNSEVFINKPPDMDYLIGKAHRTIQKRRESVLRGISLQSFLQMLEVERKTCTLIITTDDHRTGRLYIANGELIHAETDHFESKAAAFAMLSWQDYSIKIIEHCDAKPTIAERLNAILMEWCVHRDHGLI